jgi:hypothetical protein
MIAAMSEAANNIEAAFDPTGGVAPDAHLASALERTHALLRGFTDAASGLDAERVGTVRSHLDIVAERIGQAASALAAARNAKDALLLGEAAIPVSGAELAPATGQELTRAAEVATIPFEHRGWEDPRLLLSARELVGRIRNVNFRPYGSIETTGIRELRDVFMAPERLASEGVIAREDTGRLRRELIETYPDLPAIPAFDRPEPEMAAFLYETVEEAPADLILPDHVRRIMGHAVPKGQRVTMHDFISLLQQRTGFLEPPPSALIAPEVWQAAEDRAGRRPNAMEMHALSAAYDFIEKFQEARHKGGRPPRADSNPWLKL